MNCPTHPQELLGIHTAEVEVCGPPIIVSVESLFSGEVGDLFWCSYGIGMDELEVKNLLVTSTRKPRKKTHQRQRPFIDVNIYTTTPTTPHYNTRVSRVYK
jgi:hypothetical protein